MISFLEHEVKVKNQEKIDKILNAFLEEKKVGKIDSRVIKNLTDEKIMQELNFFIINSAFECNKFY